MYNRFTYRFVIPVLFLVTGTIGLSGCIDELEEVKSKGERKLVVYGRITTDPPPYEVKITESAPYIGGVNGIQKVGGATVVLHSESGESEVMRQTKPGVYRSDTLGMRGQLGESYFITVELIDGSTYHSEPETIAGKAEINDLTFEFDTRQQYSEEGVLINEDGFTLRASFDDGPERDRYLLNWNKTYKVITHPERRGIRAPWDITRIIPDPPRCSGWVRDFTVFQIRYIPFDECTCCECYITEFGETFGLVNDRLIQGNTISSELGFIPVGSEFVDKVYVQASLVQLSYRSYQYWFKIQQQLQNSGTLFDSPPGRIPGNIYADDPEGSEVLGYFMAVGSSSAVKGIDPLDIPYAFNPREYIEGIVAEDCRIATGGTNIKPAFWE
ncbi:MAG: DUF4249 domain-containing protein [Cyclobacteriaceae bacterium]